MIGMDTPYRFHHYHLLPAQRQLLNGEHPIKLGSRAFDMLVALVERRDHVVPKHELMDLVWPKLVVEENNLQVQVQVLAPRKLLGRGRIGFSNALFPPWNTPRRALGHEPKWLLRAAPAR